MARQAKAQTAESADATLPMLLSQRPQKAHLIDEFFLGMRREPGATQPVRASRTY
jgi:hypothetical protein